MSESGAAPARLEEATVETLVDPIAHILEHTRTIAVVGFSSRPEKAGYYVPAYLAEQGFTIYPVNPHLSEGLGRPAYPDLAAVPGPVDLVLIFRQPEHVPPVVKAAIAAGARAIWMQLGIRHEAAAAEARAAGLVVVMDRCLLVEHRRRA